MDEKTRAELFGSVGDLMHSGQFHRAAELLARPPHVTLKVKRLHPAAKLPTRAHPTDAGLDFYADHDAMWYCTESVAAIGTGVAVEVPAGWCLVLKARSSWASRGWQVLGGIVDHGYSGEVMVLLSSPRDYSGNVMVAKGDRIAQALLVPVPQIEVIEVDELSPSDRGANGFGSTGA